MKQLVLGLALIGGTFAMAQQKKMPPKMDPAHHQEMVEKRRTAKLDQMQNDLNLSSEQVSQIRAIQNQRQQERQLARAEELKTQNRRLDKARQQRQTMDDEMRRILTPEQYQKWQANKQGKMSARKQMHKGRLHQQHK